MKPEREQSGELILKKWVMNLSGTLYLASALVRHSNPLDNPNKGVTKQEAN